MKKIYFANRIAVVFDLLLFSSIMFLVELPTFWTTHRLSAYYWIAFLMVIFVSICRFGMQITTDDENIYLYKAFLSAGNVYRWSEIESVHFIPIINAIILKNHNKHNIWLTYIIKDYRALGRDVLERLAVNNHDIEISNFSSRCLKFFKIM